MLNGCRSQIKHHEVFVCMQFGTAILSLQFAREGNCLMHELVYDL
jgi:hypothetical protein